MTNNKAQQSAEKTAEQQQVLRDLLALGKKNGRLTLKEMADALSHLELESDDIDKLYETLESMGVEVETEGVLEKALGDGDDDSFEPGTVEEVPEEELIDTSAMAETFAIDDPVRMYLKEIGKIPLLTPEEDAVFKRGRNAAVHGIPKNATTAQYHQATALECLLGWLYLRGDTKRVNQLFTVMMEEDQPCR